MQRLNDATFSIAAADPEEGEVGVAIATKRPAVGNRCIRAVAGVGAVASQAATNPYIPEQVLELMGSGRTPEDCLKEMELQDVDIHSRQVNIVSYRGASVSFTGEKCKPYAGGRSGDCHAVGGNMLAGPGVVEAVARTFKEAEGPLPERLLAALQAGEREGGDERGKESAAILVAKVGWHPFIDLRVDSAKEPILDLFRLLELWRRERPVGSTALPDLGFRILRRGMVGMDVGDISCLMKDLGYLNAPVSSRFTRDLEAALQAFQKDNGLHASGSTDEDTVNCLRRTAAS